MNTIDQDIITPLLEWYDQNKRILPWRGSKDPYRIWVSEIMLQQTRVEAVKPYYERFMTELCDIKSLAHAREERLLKLWEGLGYYNRVRNMQKAAIQIEERFDGVFPRTYDEIQSLPGIGSYTAGAIASIAFGEAVPAVDGNVLRIISRLILYEEDVLSQKAKNEVRDMLLPFMNVSGRSGDINQAFMELGATVCVPNGAPHCEECPWKDMCLAKSKDIWQEYPRKAAKKARRMEKRTILIVGDEDHILLHKRPAKGLLASMYELINCEGELTEKEAVDVIRSLGLSPLRIQKTLPAKHIFSHIEWQMSGYRIMVEPLDYYNMNDKPDRDTDCNLDKKSDKNMIYNPDQQSDEKQSDDYYWVTKEKTEKEYAIPSAFSAFTQYFDMKPGMGKKISG